ncbi:MAG TPA: ABC transporter ATP-binding protein [Dehalococcoidia bacterium]|nr:ABC transporter ATP-binding protein [Dehalococcoidia bacterium]
MKAISIENLSKHYKNVKALDNLTLEIPENVVFGFLGPNGAGKTTTVKLLTGFSRPTSGKAFVAGEEIGNGNLNLRSKTGLLPDVPTFYDWMNGREFLYWVGELFHLPKPDIKARTEELLQLVELEKAANRRIGGYSRGMKQRLGIAQALFNHPKVLFLDEPTSALDPIGRRDVLTLVKRLKQEATVFMSTHILADVERVCDMVAIVNRGKLVLVSTVEALREKYAHSVFDMEFLEDSRNFAEHLKHISYLSEPELIGENGTQVLRIKALDISQARSQLPRLIAESGLTLSRYELNLPNLEDIFMEVINGGVAK